MTEYNFFILRYLPDNYVFYIKTKWNRLVIKIKSYYDFKLKSKFDLTFNYTFKSKYSIKFLRSIKDPVIIDMYLTYMKEEIVSKYPQLKNIKVY